MIQKKLTRTLCLELEIKGIKRVRDLNKGCKVLDTTGEEIYFKGIDGMYGRWLHSDGEVSIGHHWGYLKVKGYYLAIN